MADRVQCEGIIMSFVIFLYRSVLGNVLDFPRETESLVCVCVCVCVSVCVSVCVCTYSQSQCPSLHLKAGSCYIKRKS